MSTQGISLSLVCHTCMLKFPTKQKLSKNFFKNEMKVLVPARVDISTKAPTVYLH